MEHGRIVLGASRSLEVSTHGGRRAIVARPRDDLRLVSHLGEPMLKPHTPAHIPHWATLTLCWRCD